MAYLGWLTSLEAQKMIDEFKKNNENLFFPVKKNFINNSVK